MTPKEKAELRFKRKQADGQIATSDYEQRARAEREKMLRLRTLRLARDAKLGSKPEQTGHKTEQKRGRQRSSKAAL
jgi:hypothetical protein